MPVADPGCFMAHLILGHKKKGLSQKLLAKKLSAVRFIFLIFLFRKLAMRYAIILFIFYLKQLTVFNKQKFYRGDLSYREP